MENDTLTSDINENIRIKAIRVSLVEEGMSGPCLGLSLDEEKNQDESFYIQGVNFIVDKLLLKQCGGINIDFIETGSDPGFKVTPTNPLLSGYDC